MLPERHPAVLAAAQVIADRLGRGRSGYPVKWMTEALEAATSPDLGDDMLIPFSDLRKILDGVVDTFGERAPGAAAGFDPDYIFLSYMTGQAFDEELKG